MKTVMEKNVDTTCELSNDDARDRQRAMMLEKLALCFVKMEPPDDRSAFAEIRIEGDDELARRVAAALCNLQIVLSQTGSLSLVPSKATPSADKI
jgi:hypothetical protein